MLLPLLLACTSAEPDDTASPDDTGETDDTGDTGVRTLVIDDTWEPTACGSVRVIFDGDGIDVGIDATVDVWTAGTTGTPVTVTTAIGDPRTQVFAQEPDYTGERCGTVEGFGPDGFDPHWAAVEGTFTITYTPSQTFPSDDDSWTYDGTVVGTVTVDFDEVVLEHRLAEDTDTIVLTGEPVTTDLTVPQLPA